MPVLVEVFTDHKNLVYFCKSKMLSCQQVRWSEFLWQFNLAIKFYLGRLGAKPNVLTLSQTSFGHISINSPSILTVLMATESPWKDLLIGTSHVSRWSIMVEILGRSTGNHCKKAKLQAGIKPTALCSAIDKENSIEPSLDFPYYLYNYYMVCALFSHAYHVTHVMWCCNFLSCDCDYVTLVTWHFPVLPSV